ncbi:protein kinase, putative [Trypanosoma brucei gambiense DAL972]|uniref:Protein kinase, putative n=1 Tax=Trypanosoma brucei gambiense (strain MHOM/CI/86/DAL972) TaxID=679716 RepID=C9ZYK5_TRYB9|nr:protein kinase, putative [Trypanosoma brucei gambiense DAL972]CBH14504.1 protein kinase, putative [Trypanosoma brucei gambiense DAL972]|eukprot:XP_011776770.1 protein kinase, putative [Trypanosoma brucei gambiense DAL972]
MLDIKIEKYDIFVEKVKVVQRRIEQLNQWPSVDSMVRYKEARLSPRYLLVTAEEPTDGILEPLELPMGEEDACMVIMGLLRALHALHMRKLVHGHLRPEVLRRHSASGRIVLLQQVLTIDLFDPSSDAGQEVWRCCAPEIMRASPFDYSADIWGLGAVLLQLVAPAGKVYETEDLVELDIISPEVSSLSSSVVSFVMQCLQEDAHARPTIAELIMHPLLTNRDGLDKSCTEEEEDEEESEPEEEKKENDAAEEEEETEESEEADEEP